MASQGHYNTPRDAVELPEDLEMTPYELSQMGATVFRSPHCEICKRRLKGWPCSGPDPLLYKCSAKDDPNEQMRKWADERARRKRGKATLDKKVDSFDCLPQHGTLCYPWMDDKFYEKRLGWMTWLDQAMKDIERLANEQPPLDGRAERFHREAPPKAKTPGAYQESRSAPKFLGIPERK